ELRAAEPDETARAASSIDPQPPDPADAVEAAVEHVAALAVALALELFEDAPRPRLDDGRAVARATAVAGVGRRRSDQRAEEEDRAGASCSSPGSQVSRVGRPPLKHRPRGGAAVRMAERLKP